MLSVYSYRLPFKTPFRSSSMELNERTGWILRITNHGATAYAEFSPLPGFGTPDEKGLSYFSGGFTKLEEKCKTLVSLPFFEIGNALENEFSSPGLKFALSALLVQLEAAKQRIAIQDLFSIYPQDRVKVNDIWSLPITPLDSTELHEMIRSRLQLYRSAGLTDVKIKSDNDFDRLKRILKAVSEWKQETNSSIQLKLDFNYSLNWKELSTFDKTLSEDEKNLIRYIEDPVKLSSIHDIAKLRDNSTLAIALDESFMQLYPDDPDNLLSEMSSYSIGPIVLKPAIFGSLFAISDLENRCSTLGIDLVISSMLESSVGRTLTLQVAKLFGSPYHSHGLWTGPLLEQDLYEDPVREEFISHSKKDSSRLNDKGLFPDLTEHHPSLSRIF